MNKIMELEEILPLKEKYLDELKAIAELEKQNGILAHQLKYAETILTDVQADKFKLRASNESLEGMLQVLNCSYDKLKAQNEIMREALFQISEDDGNVCLHSDDATESLKKIGKG